MLCAEQLASAALPLILPPCSELEPGVHELRVGIEGNADGYNFALGRHGRLTVTNRVVPLADSLTNALALALAAVPAKKRAELVKRLAAQAAAGGELAEAKTAGRIRRTLEKRTGVAWVATPGWKPRC
jgi:hypothetical protein